MRKCQPQGTRASTASMSAHSTGAHHHPCRYALGCVHMLHDAFPQCVNPAWHGTAKHACRALCIMVINITVRVYPAT